MILNPACVPYFWELSSNACINYCYYYYLIICLKVRKQQPSQYQAEVDKFSLGGGGLYKNASSVHRKMQIHQLR